MAASTEKRLLTAPNSKLTKANLVALLRNDSAWILLPLEIRQQLYTLLPSPPLLQPLAEGEEGAQLHDPDIHPLNTRYKTYIEEELRRYRDDLKEGREQKKWREEAMQAGKDRVEGKFDEWKEVEREEYWGKREEEQKENADVVNGEGGKVNGDGDGIGNDGEEGVENKGAVGV